MITFVVVVGSTIRSDVWFFFLLLDVMWEMLIISFVYFDALSFLVFLFFSVLLNHYSQNHMGYLIIVGKYMRRKFYQSKFYVIIFVFFFCFQLNLIYRRFVYSFCSRKKRKPLIIYRFKLLFLSVFVCLFLSLFVCSWSECFVKYRTQQQQKKKSKLKNILEIEGREREREKKGVKMHRINFFGIYNNNTLFANRQSGYSTTTTTKVRLWCKVFLFISISTSMNSKEPKNKKKIEYGSNIDTILNALNTHIAWF